MKFSPLKLFKVHFSLSTLQTFQNLSERQFWSGIVTFSWMKVDFICGSEVGEVCDSFTWSDPATALLSASSITMELSCFPLRRGPLSSSLDKLSHGDSGKMKNTHPQSGLRWTRSRSRHKAAMLIKRCTGATLLTHSSVISALLFGKATITGHVCR